MQILVSAKLACIALLFINFMPRFLHKKSQENPALNFICYATINVDDYVALHLVVQEKENLPAHLHDLLKV